MRTLAELVEEQKWTKESDMRIILKFLDINDKEEEAMDLINDLVKTKIEKLKRKHRLASEWAHMLPSKYLYETYDLDTADNLHNLELYYLTHGGELSKGYLEWARENLPNIERPMAYFNPLVDYLKEKDIRFKDRKRPEEET